jgi:hypothetical protein
MSELEAFTSEPTFNTPEWVEWMQNRCYELPCRCRPGKHLIKKALGNNPEAVAEARRRIEAGETVTVEGLCREMGETEEPKP